MVRKALEQEYLALLDEMRQCASGLDMPTLDLEMIKEDISLVRKGLIGYELKAQQAYIKAHYEVLNEVYPIRRSWCVANYHWLLGLEFTKPQVPRIVNEHYMAVRGQRPESLPPQPEDIPWRLILNRLWNRQLLEYRKDFEKAWREQYPGFPFQGRCGDWKGIATGHGVECVWDYWNQTESEAIPMWEAEREIEGD